MKTLPNPSCPIQISKKISSNYLIAKASMSTSTLNRSECKRTKMLSKPMKKVAKSPASTWCTETWNSRVLLWSSMKGLRQKMLSVRLQNMSSWPTRSPQVRPSQSPCPANYDPIQTQVATTIPVHTLTTWFNSACESRSKYTARLRRCSLIVGMAVGKRNQKALIWNTRQARPSIKWKTIVLWVQVQLKMAT